MYQLYQKYKDQDLFLLIPLVILNLGKILNHYFWRLFSGWGFPQSADSNWYLNYANTLMSKCKIGLHMNDILYFGYNVLLTLLLAVFEDPVVILFIQSVTAGLSVILVYKIAKLLFNRTTAVIASLFYFYLYDITLWAMYILSESFFISLLLLCVYFLLMALETDKKSYKIAFAVASLYLLVFRPTGVISVLFMLVYIVIRLNKITVVNFVKRHRKGIGSTLFALIAAFLYLFYNQALDPFITSMQYNVKLVLYNVYAKGWLYDKPTPYDYVFRPDYSITVCNSLTLSFIINNWEHVLVLYAKRTIAFLGKWVWETDLTSLAGMGPFIWNVMPTFLFISGTVAAIGHKTFRKASILWLMVLAVFVFCILLFIDWMYRYRSPATPFVAIIAAYGAERIIFWVRFYIKKCGDAVIWKRENC